MFLHPDLSVVERVVTTAMGRADWRVFNQINGHLGEYQQRMLDHRLVPETDKFESRFSWVHQPVGKPCPSNLLAIIERLRAIQALGIPVAVVDSLSVARRPMLSREGNRVAVHNLRLFGDSRRHAVMAVTLLELRCALVDEALGMHDPLETGAAGRGSPRRSMKVSRSERLNPLGMRSCV